MKFCPTFGVMPVVRRQQDPGQPRERRADAEGDQAVPLDIDPHEPGRPPVLGHGAHRAAEAEVAQKQAEPDGHGGGHHEDRDAPRVDPDRPQVERLRGELVAQRVDRAAGDDERQALQQQHQPERPPAAASRGSRWSGWMMRRWMTSPSTNSTGTTTMKVQVGAPAQPAVGEVGGVHAHHDQLALSEVDHPGDPEDEVQTHAHEAVDPAEQDPDHDDLDEGVHVTILGSRKRGELGRSVSTSAGRYRPGARESTGTRSPRHPGAGRPRGRPSRSCPTATAPR